MIAPMEPATTLRFATTACALAHAARAHGLAVPGFRSPPGVSGANRTLRRRGASASIAVRVRGRPWADVLTDMIEGIVVVNGLSGAAADAARAALAAATGDELAARRAPPSSRVA
jgi:hypothetical protein